MNPLLQQALPYLALPVVAIALAGVVTTFYRPGPMAKSYIQHFAAGMVVAAVSVELLPQIRAYALAFVLAGFTLGTVSMLGVKWVTEEILHGRVGRAGENGEQINLGLVATVVIDVLVDGLLIGLGFALGAQTGLLLTVALATEGFFLSLAFAVELTEAGTARWKTIAGTIGLGLVLAVGAVVGILVLGAAPDRTLALVLAFGAAALLYLVTEELLVEAHEHGERFETPLTAATFFVGFMLILGIAMAAGH